MALFQKYANFIANTAYETWEKEDWSKPTIFFQLDAFLYKVSRMVQLFTQDYEHDNCSNLHWNRFYSLQYLQISWFCINL